MDSLVPTLRVGAPTVTLCVTRRPAGHTAVVDCGKALSPRAVPVGKRGTQFPPRVTAAVPWINQVLAWVIPLRTCLLRLRP